MLIPSLITVAFMGLFLLGFGLRGKRLNDHPWCRRCRYDLSGLESPTTCPECGGDLSKRRAVRIGQSRRRPIVLALGALLLIATIAATAFLAMRVDWTPYKPVWVLLIESESGARQQERRAHREFSRRFSDGLLSNGQIRRIADAGLRIQRDEDAPWDRAWGNFIETAWFAGRLDEDRFRTYCENGLVAVHQGMLARPRVRAGAPLQVMHDLSPWFAQPRNMRCGDGLWATASLLRITRDGEVVWEPSTNPLWDVHIWGGSSLYGGGARPLALQLEPGEHTLVFEVDFAIRREEMGSTFCVEGFANEAIFKWTQKLPIKIVVVNQNESTVAIVSDPSLADAIRDSIDVAIVKEPYADKWHVHLGGSVSVQQPPVSVSFDIYARYEGQEQKIGNVYAPRDGQPRAPERIEHPRAIWPDARFVDLIFRTNPEHAERTPDILEIWDGEITINDVPVIGPPYPGDPDQ